MRYANCSLWTRLFLIALTACITGGPSATAQLPPARATVVGDLELVASLAGDQPAGVAISNSGRLFVSYPRHDGDVAFTVGEIKGNHAAAYPTTELNRATVDHAKDTLFSVQTLQVDASEHLWLLDTGTLQFGQPPVKGAPKLVEIDLASNQVIRTVLLPEEALVPNSALKDFRFDFHHGQGGVVFITDSAPGAEAMIVLDLQSGHGMRRLIGSPAISARGGVTQIVGSQPLLDWPIGPKKQGSPKPWLVGLNALELSADKKTLYFSAFTGHRLYAVDAGNLADPSFDNAKLIGTIKELGPIGMAGHFSLDTNGRLYFMDMEQNAIYRRTSDGRVTALVVDPRLIWPDTMVLGNDEYLYVTTSQQDLRAEFHDGDELRQQPYGLYRVYVGSMPIRAIER
jgi:sugar lactone lactonase YvrE